jgi:hypothetical protein
MEMPLSKLREQYKRFLFVFFGLNAKYRTKETVRETQYFAVAQATFFLAALSIVLVGTVLAFLTDIERPSSPTVAISWCVAIYTTNLLLLRHWVGVEEMQRMVTAATPEDLKGAERSAVILLGFTVPAIMFLIILVSWYVRG